MSGSGFGGAGVSQRQQQEGENPGMFAPVPPPGVQNMAALYLKVFVLERGFSYGRLGKKGVLRWEILAAFCLREDILRLHPRVMCVRREVVLVDDGSRSSSVS